MDKAELLTWLEEQVASGKRLSEIWRAAPLGVGLLRIRRYLLLLNQQGYGMKTIYHRHKQAYELRLKGYTYAAIAKELNFSNAAAAHKAVKSYSEKVDD